VSPSVAPYIPFRVVDPLTTNKTSFLFISLFFLSYVTKEQNKRLAFVRSIIFLGLRKKLFRKLYTQQTQSASDVVQARKNVVGVRCGWDSPSRWWADGERPSGVGWWFWGLHGAIWWWAGG